MKSSTICAITVALLFIIPIAVNSQSLEYVNSTLWTGANDVEVAGSYAYCAYASGIIIFDISNPTSPDLISKLPCKGMGARIAVSGLYAYLADGYGGLKIVGISNPVSPRLVFTYETNGNVTDVKVRGNYAYLIDDSTGMQILNIANPGNPILVGTYTTQYIGTVLDISGDFAYVGYKTNTWHSILHVVDISHPAEPEFASDLSDLFFSSSMDIVLLSLKDSLLIAGTGNYDWHGQDEQYFYIFNVLNPLIAQLIGHGYISNNYFSSVQFHENYAYFSSDLGIEIYDFNNISNFMWRVGNYYHTASSNISNSIFIEDNKIYAAFRDMFEVIDISSPPNPVIQGNCHFSNNLSRVVLSGNYAYVLDNQYSVLNILDISNSDMRVVSRYSLFPANVQDISISGNYCYCALAYYGLRVINIENPASPLLIGDYPIADGLTKVFANGNRAYGANTYHYYRDYNASYIIDTSDPSNPFLAGEYVADSSGPHKIIFLRDNYAYVTYMFSPNLRIVDIDNVEDPALMSSGDYGADAIFVRGDYLYLCAIELYILNISDASTPTVVSQSPYPASSVWVSENYAFIGHSDSVSVLDVSDVANPIYMTSFRVMGGRISDIAVKDTMCYVTSEGALFALRLYRSQGIESGWNPASFSLSPNYPNPFNAQTTIGYSLPEAGPVNITVYNIIGQKIAVIENGIETAGEHRTVWDVTGVPSGLYFARLEMRDQSLNIKMTVVK